ncbi:MAG: hypothetical protein FWG02_10585 [Holophagaceae bacterium]|nr:hypothetical protein [Holophagaceae bacterium]
MKIFHPTKENMPDDYKPVCFITKDRFPHHGFFDSQSNTWTSQDPFTFEEWNTYEADEVTHWFVPKGAVSRSDLLDPIPESFPLG